MSGKIGCEGEMLAVQLSSCGWIGYQSFKLDSMQALPRLSLEGGVNER